MVALRANVGRYQLLDVISNTGLAFTYRALDLETDRTVALKVLHRYFEADPGLVERYFAELRVVAQWQHPNILPVYGLGCDDGSYWVASPLVPAGSLRDQAYGPLTLGQAAAITAPVARALEFAHQHGVLHRNLKPGNVLLTPDGTVLLADFGSATLGAGAHPLIRATLTTPLPSFMSPEQAGGSAMDPRSDGYSLGSLVYWMLTGQVPFPGNSPETVYAQQVRFPLDPPSRINVALPREANRVVLKALAPFPDARYPRCEQFAAELTEVAREHGSPVEVPPVTALTELGASAHAAQPDGKPDTAATAAGTVAAGERNGHGTDLGWQTGWGKQAKYVGWRQRLPWLGIAGLLAAALAWYGTLPPPELPPATSQLSSASPPGQWTMPRHDLGNTGATNLGMAFKGEVRWSFPTSDRLEASPAVTEDTVYVATTDHRILALDAATGSVKWGIPTPDLVSASPVIAGEFLFQGLRDGRLLALDARTGNTRWELAGGKTISSAVTVADGVLYLPSSDGNLYTLDAATGARRWSFPVGGWVAAPPAVSEDRVAVGSQEGWIYALDVRSGAQLYDFKAGGPVVTAPSFIDNVVYIASANRRVSALDTTQRVRLWERERDAIQIRLFLFGWMRPPPPPSGLVWQQAAGKRGFSSSAVSRDLVLVGNEDGKLHAWRKADGKPAWEFDAGSPVLSDPSIAGDTVYIGSDGGKLFALDLATGTLRWELVLAGRIRSSPAPTKHGLYVTAGETVYALR